MVFSTVKSIAILDVSTRSYIYRFIAREGGRGWAYRLDVICELVLSADELNNGQELKGLLATVNLWPLC